MTILRAINAAIGPMARRVRLMIGRGVINLVNDATKEQTVQLAMLGEETRDCERYQHYGFTSRPHPGAEAIAVSVMGSRAHSVVVADGDRRYRLKTFETGEVALYDDLGQFVKLTRYGIEISSGLKVTLNAPEIVVNTASFDINQT